MLSKIFQQGWETQPHEKVEAFGNVKAENLWKKY